MRLYIIRHAETEYNRKGIIQGSEVDSDINDKGDIQAKSFYEYYKDINFDKIYVSALKRTFQTIRRFLDKGILYEKLKEFNEISWGINQGKSDDLEDYSKLINTWLSGNLDNYAIWDIALSESEIQSHMNTELSGEEDGLIGYWNFNEGEGSELTLF